MIIPQSLYAVLVQAVKELMRGRAISIVPVTANLTTQQAADMLNVSRPFLVKLLEKGAIPVHRTGTHRRVYLKHLLAYKRKRDEEAQKALGRLVAEAQQLGIYDESLARGSEAAAYASIAIPSGRSSKPIRGSLRA